MTKLLRIIRTYTKALTKAIWIFGPGMLTKKGREAVRQVSHQRVFAEEEFQPQFNWEEREAVYDGFDIRIVPSGRQTGDVADPELYAICALVRRYSPKNIFEIGTFRGRTTLHLALNSPPDAKVSTLDLPAESADSTSFGLDRTAHRYIGRVDQGECFSRTTLPERKKISQLWGDSAEFNFAPYLDNCDFVFVDGAHSYEYVIHDTKVAFSLLRDGEGVIVWHDYGVKRQPGVYQGLGAIAQDPRYRQAMSKCSWIRGTTLAYLRMGGENQ